MLDGVLDYPTWYSLVSAFTNPSGNITELAVKVWDSQARYRTGEFLVGSFLDNHDNPRFMSFVKDHAVRFVHWSVRRLASTHVEPLHSSSGTQWLGRSYRMGYLLSIKACNHKRQGYVTVGLMHVPQVKNSRSLAARIL